MLILLLIITINYFQQLTQKNYLSRKINFIPLRS